MREEVAYWLEQAKADMKTAKDCLKDGNYYAAAFFSQQNAEKALKALYLHKKKKHTNTHSLVFISRELGAPARIIDAASELTSTYINSRYPEAALGPPVRIYTKEKAERHIAFAKEVYGWTTKQLKSL